jgi:predicted aldo/keto reductase-like oxidoreductase
VLGKTGMKVPMLGFGSHLNARLKANPKLRDRMIKAGFEGGIFFFDVYDHGGYEQFDPMGKSIRDFRAEALISICAVRATKELPGEIDYALQKFSTDHIDCVRLQRVDDDRIAVLDKAKQAGKIRAVGVVSHDANQMIKFVDRYSDTLDYVMIVYNFHHNIGRPKKDSGMPANDYSALIPYCERLSLGILGIKPMGSDDMVAFARERGYYNRKGLSLSHAKLRHVYANEMIDCVMPAMNTMAELADNLESAYRPTISDEEENLLRTLSRDADSMRAMYLRPRYRWLEKWAGRREEGASRLGEVRHEPPSEAS